MKKTFLSFFLGLILFSGFTSCKKDNSPPVKSKTDYLTAVTWLYEEYFTNYNSASTQLAYKLGKANNSMNMTLDRVKFNKDGTYQETTETGQQLTGTWKFLNNESKTQVTNSTGVYTADVIILNDSKYEWYDEVNGRYGKMIPAN